MARPKIVTGSRALCYVNGKLLGVVTSFSWSSATPRKKIRTIDIAHPVELAATTVEVNWQMGVLRTVGDGGMQGVGVVADQVNVIKEKYFSILVIERQTNLTLFKADLCQTESESWNLMAKSLMQGQVSGSGIIWVNESST